jgi:hypothetical protein
MATSPVPLPAPKYLTPRAIMFLLWLVAANDWVNRHLGIGWDGPVLTLALAALGTGFGLIEMAYGVKLKEKWLGRMVQIIMQFPLLVALYVALGAVASVLSSVTLLNDPPDTVFDATLQQADHADAKVLSQDNRSNPKNPVRFLHVWIRPFGRPYRLDVKGYLPVTFQIYPLAGVTLSPRRDLRVNPSVLFRPPLGALGPMAGGVRAHVWSETKSGGQGILLADATVKKESILLGAEQPVPAGLLEGWRLEALAQGITSAQPLFQLLQCWKQPKILTPKSPLEPDSILVAVVCNATSQPLAEAQVRLTEDRFQDVPMHLVASIGGLDERKGWRLCP